MYRTPEQAQPPGSDHPHWITVRTTRTVLIVVHTMTAWNRLSDILPVFDSDRRIQLVFTFPDAEDDPISVVIDYDGNATYVLDGENASTYAILTPDNIRDIGRAQRKVLRRFVNENAKIRIAARIET